MLSKFFLTKWVDVCVLNQMKENIYQKSQKQIIENHFQLVAKSLLYCVLLTLQLAKNVGNNSFNDIMEANLPSPSPKPTPSSDM
jgi:hypothetical protein